MPCATGVRLPCHDTADHSQKLGRSWFRRLDMIKLLFGFLRTYQMVETMIAPIATAMPLKPRSAIAADVARIVLPMSRMLGTLKQNFLPTVGTVKDAS